MPYVEGFGTYPFGEEWLFDAVIRSYLPVLRRRRATHAHGHAGARRPARGARGRRAPAGVPARATGSARARPTSATSSRPTATPAGPRPTATARRSRGSRRSDGDLLRLFAEPAASGTGRAARLGRDPRGAPARSPPARAGACRSTPGCARTGGASASRTGSGCPSAPTSPGSSGCSPSAGCATSAPIRAPRGAARRAGAGRGRRADRSPSRSTGRRSQWLWSLDGYPSDPLHADFHRKSLRGCASVGDRRRRRTTRRRRPSAPASRAASSSPRSPRGSSASPPSAGGRD